MKRTDGCQYFGKAYDLMSLPSFECMQLSRLRMIKPTQTEHNERFEKLLKKEDKIGWNWLVPQFSVLKHNSYVYPKPKLYSRPGSRNIEQNWNSYFKFWFYDERSSEPVILLKENEKWRMIRLLDPVWLVNCSRQDIDLLNEVEIYASEGFHDVGVSYKDMALQFQTMARMCYTLGIHSGCRWDDVNYLYVELMKLQN